MKRLAIFVWPPLLVATVVLAYTAFNGGVDAEVVVAVALFLAVAATVGVVTTRVTRTRK